MEMVDDYQLRSAVNMLVEECHFDAKSAGCWEHQPDVTALVVKLALVHSEISEALEGLRKNKDDDHIPTRKAFEVELADACIRIFDLAGVCNLDLGGALVEKKNYNKARADHKPENRAKEGGKKF